ncbi:MAG: ATP-dependent Clp protease adaptor protein ClpS [Alteromonadaceae bacterium]|jgi:ATP-dependent Clp protease adaptor protein ClpS|tara:strand:- start:375 stop:695 length:321 start_codon:yes stop_codon:yes gene_type:complete
MSNWKEQLENQETIEEELKDKLKPPSMYNVILLNDDFTPMDFVTDVLQRFFYMNGDNATDIMLTIHYKGKAVCGNYSAEVAETKVQQVLHYSKENQHPLKCIMEQS